MNILFNLNRKEQQSKYKNMGTKYLFTGILIVLFLFLSNAVVSAQEDTASAELLLQGNVPRVLEISVNSEGADDLNLLLDVTDLKIATVTERSNVLGGYTVYLESENVKNEGSTVLASADPDNLDSLAYSLKYGGEPINFEGGESAILTESGTKTSYIGNINDLLITYAGQDEFLYEGTYSDTLTFTISVE